MASDNPGMKPPGRRPPTIDLTATEVASEAAQSAAAAAASEEPRRAETSDTPPPPRGPGMWFRLSDGLPSDPPWRAIGAAAGFVLLVVAGGLVWWSGLLTASPRGNVDLDARLARIEQQMRELFSRAGPSADIAARIDRIEAALARPGSDAALVGRMTQAEAALKTVSDELGTIRSRLDEIASIARTAQSRADAAASAAEAAQQSSQTTNAQLARAALSDDRASRRAVAANSLRTAVERGEPYSAELAAARSLATDASGLAPLEPFAANGIGTESAFARDLTALIPTIVRASSSLSPDAGFLERLQANAERLVRVRPVGEPAGTDVGSTIARIESKAAQSDIDGALAELGKLPPAVRAPAESWMKAASQRKAAIEASRLFARDALAALGKPAL